MSEPTLQATIPGVPESVNHSHGYGRGRAWRTPATDSWLNDVVRLVRNRAVHQAGLRDRWRAACRTGSRVRVLVVWYRPDARTRDMDNALKVLGDGIATALDLNDEHFDWTTRSAHDPSNPRVELSISLEGSANG